MNWDEPTTLFLLDSLINFLILFDCDFFALIWRCLDSPIKAFSSVRLFVILV